MKGVKLIIYLTLYQLTCDLYLKINSLIYLSMPLYIHNRMIIITFTTEWVYFSCM